MDVPISQAKARLTELVSRAEAGEEVILTRHGRPAVRLQPIRRIPTPEEKRAIIDEISRAASANILPGPCAARSQDFLYDENGLPG